MLKNRSLPIWWSGKKIVNFREYNFQSLFIRLLIKNFKIFCYVLNTCSLYNQKKFKIICFQAFKIAFQCSRANSIALANSIAPTTAKRKGTEGHSKGSIMLMPPALYANFPFLFKFHVFCLLPWSLSQPPLVDVCLPSCAATGLSALVSPVWWVCLCAVCAAFCCACC